MTFLLFAFTATTNMSPPAVSRLPYKLPSAPPLNVRCRLEPLACEASDNIVLGLSVANENVMLGTRRLSGATLLEPRKPQATLKFSLINSVAHSLA